MISGPLVASLCGIAATTQIHVAKICQQYGLGALSHSCRNQAPEAKTRKLVYALGILLNYTAFGWALLANINAPSMYFTAMFGFGLPVHSTLLSICLGERQGKARHLSIVLIAMGTILACIGTTNVSSGVAQLNSTVILSVSVLTGGLIWMLHRLLSRKRRLDGAAVAWGVLCGGAAALDPMFKSLGQAYGLSKLSQGTSIQIGLVPATTVGWLLFALSFLLGAMAFLLTQYAYLRRMRAGTMVAAAGISTVVLPVLLTKVLNPATSIPALQLAGLGLILIGFVTMFRNFRSWFFTVCRLPRRLLHF